MEFARGVKRLRTESSSSETDVAEFSDGSSSDEETNVIDLVSDEPSSQGTSSSVAVPGSSKNKSKKKESKKGTSQSADSDESITIVYEKIRPTPDLHVELNKGSNELLIDFFKRDCTPYYGHFSRKVRIGRKKVKLSISVTIGSQNANKQKKKKSESGSSQSDSDSASNQSFTVQCGVCLDNLEEIFSSGRNLWSTMCGHIFCNVCVERCQVNFKQCPTCCKKLTKKQYHPIFH